MLPWTIRLTSITGQKLDGYKLEISTREVTLLDA
jgi:hypothetical protein